MQNNRKFMQKIFAKMQNWDDLKFFLCIARHRSLAGAARELHVNHSTVFRRLNALESGAGIRLFERLPDGYTLTEAGEQLMEHAARVGEIVDGIDRLLMGRDYRLSGSIRLTTTDTMADSYLQPHLKKFRDRYPDIVLELVTDNVFYDLSRREADVAIRPTNEPPQHLVGPKLGTVGWAVYGARGYLEVHGRPRRVTDLAAHAIISGDDSLASVPAVRWLRTQVPESAIVLRASSFVVQLAAARAGCGLALVPCVLAHDDPTLERVLGPVKPLATGLYLLTHADLRHTARIRAFIAFMTDAIHDDRARLAGTS